MNRRKKFGTHQVLIPETLYYKQAELTEKICKKKLVSIPENGILKAMEIKKQEIEIQIPEIPREISREIPIQELEIPKEISMQEIKNETTITIDDDFEIISN